MTNLCHIAHDPDGYREFTERHVLMGLTAIENPTDAYQLKIKTDRYTKVRDEEKAVLLLLLLLVLLLA